MRSLFGADLFISYAHLDAGDYSIALDHHLPSLSVYLDRYLSQPGEQISAPVRRQLRNAAMLLVIASPASVSSRAIADEIARFRKTGRQILIIDVDDSLRRTEWRALVDGIGRTTETIAALKAGSPSEAVLWTIQNAFAFRTRAQRLRIAAMMTAAFFVSMFATLFVISRQSVQAVGAQRTIVAAQTIASAARRAWTNREASPETALIMEAESLRRSANPEAFRLAGELLPLVPRLAWKVPGYDVRYQQISASDDGRWVALTPIGSSGIRLLDGRDGKTIWSDDDCFVDFVSFARDAPRVAVQCSENRHRLVFIDLERRAVVHSIAVRDKLSGLDFIGPYYLAHVPTWRSGLEPLELHRVMDDAVVAQWASDHATGARNHIAFASNDHTVEIRRVDALNAPPRIVSLPSAPIDAIDFSPNEQLLLVRVGGELRLFDLAHSAKPAGAIQIGPGMTDVAVSDDGSELMTLSGGGISVTTPPNWVVTDFVRGAANSFTQRWKRPLQDYSMIPTIGMTNAGLVVREGKSVSLFGSDGNEVSRVRADGNVAITRGPLFAIDHQTVHAWMMHGAWASDEHAIAFSRDASRVLVIAPNSVIVRDVETGRSLFQQQPSKMMPMVADFSPNGSTVIIAQMSQFLGGPGGVQIRDLRDGTTRSIPNAIFVTTAVALSADGKLGASAADVNAVRIFDTVTGRQLEAFAVQRVIHRLAFSHDATKLAGVDQEFRLWIFDLKRREVFEVGSVGGPPDRAATGGALMAFAPDDASVIVAARGRIEQLPLARDGKPLWSIAAPGTFIGLALSPSASELAIAAANPARLTILDAKTRAKKAELPLTFTPLGVAYPSDGSDPVVIDITGRTHTMYRDATQAVRDICRAVGRSLTKEEWTQLIGDEPYVETCGAGVVEK